MLNLGAATFNYLNRLSFEQALDHLAECGFRYIEMTCSPPHLFPRELDSFKRQTIRREIQSRGIQAVSLQPTYLDLNIISLNPAIREESIRQVKENIELAADIGAQLFVLVTGRRHPLLPMPIEQAWELALESIRECNQVASDRNVIIGIENVRNQFIDRASDVRKMVEDLAEENIKAVIDVANANMLESPLDALDTVKDHLVLVHLSDNDGRNWTHSPVGVGNVDFASVAKKLKEIHFDGHCILEVTYDENPKWAMEESKSKLELLGWRT